MGMFDEIQCKLPLPIDFDLGVDHRDYWFQTKSLERRLEYFVIDENRILSKRNSERIETASGEVSYAHHLERVDYTGELRFYTNLSSLFSETAQPQGWIEFSTYFVRGELKEFHLIELRSYEEFQNDKKNNDV